VCSAGVGRTGAVIVIDAMLERIKHEKTLDVYGHVTCLRSQRNYMVQTEDQYVFIHDALVEAIQSGNTELPARNLFTHIQRLTRVEPGDSVTGMELEFKVRLLRAYRPSVSQSVCYIQLVFNKFQKNFGTPYLTLPPGWAGSYTCPALRPYLFSPMRVPE